MPSGARRWTLYNLSWVLLALKASFTITRTKDINNVEQLAYTRASTRRPSARPPCSPARLQKSVGRLDDGCLSPGTATLRVYARACTALLVLPCFTHLPPGACMHIHAHAVLCVLCVHMHMCMHMHMCTHRFIHAHAQCVCCTIPPGSRSCRPGCLTRTPARPSGRPSSICARATRRATRSTVWFGRSVHGARSRAAPARVLSIRIRD